jgi:hypothetical protein
MMRATSCLFALGFGAALTAACGDDEGGTGDGGNGGRAGRSGLAGRAGAAASGGAAGRGGASGIAGTGGAAGMGGGSAGASGSGGNAGEPADAGADAATDAGEAVDGGPQPTACPASFEAVADGIEGQDTQNVIISRIVFRNGGADVTFRGVGNGTFDFAPQQALCSGSEDADCDEGVQDLDRPDDGGANALAVGEEVTFFKANVDVVGGELALVNDLPSEDPDTFVFAYIAWGTFTSVPPVGVDGALSLDERASNEGADGIWSLGDRVENGVDTTIFVLGEVNASDFEVGFDSCTQD